MLENEEVPYIFVPKREHQTRKQPNSLNLKDMNLKVNDIVSIYLTNHENVIKECECENRKIQSPIFEILEMQYHQLTLRIMEVKYPASLYYSDSDIENILNAIKEGLVVVLPTNYIFSLRHSQIEKVKVMNIRRVSHIESLVAESLKYVCSPMESIEGGVQCNNPNQGEVVYYLSGDPLYGTVLLNNETGIWKYTNTVGSMVTDAFFITIWDRCGAYIEQKVIVKINDMMDVFYMEEQEIIHSLAGDYYGKVYNISQVKELGAFVQNQGSELIEVEIECGPNGNLFIKEPLSHQVPPGETIFLTPTYFPPFVRLKFITRNHIHVHVWYYGKITDGKCVNGIIP